MAEEEIRKEKSSSKNYWMFSTLVLAAVLIIILIFRFTSPVTGNVIKEDAAGQAILDFAEQQGIQATLVSVTDTGSLYEVVINIEGQDAPVYITKDGKYFISQPYPLTGQATADTNTQTQTPQEVVKSDKPIIDAYVFSYCPYGTQFEKGLIPVYDLLKNKAEFNIVFIGAMHGKFEETESLRQLCILKNYGKDKLFEYLDKFNTNAEVGNCQGTDTCVNPIIESIYTQLAIDKNKINTCMTSDAPALYQADEQKSASNGVSGSPTLIINGAEAQSARDSESIKQIVCSAFTTMPAECAQTLSSASPSPGFGGSTTAASTGAQC